MTVEPQVGGARLAVPTTLTRDGWTVERCDDPGRTRWILTLPDSERDDLFAWLQYMDAGMSADECIDYHLALKALFQRTTQRTA